jgi:glycosyltransferase involved in cell wall biosynthesis
MLKIAIFTDTYAPEINGVSLTLAKLQRFLRERQVPHLLFAPDYAGITASEKGLALMDEAHVQRVKSIQAPFYKQSRLALPSYQKLKAVVEEFRPDLIHVTTPLPIGWCGMKIARELKVPLVMSYHTNFEMYLKYYKLEYMERWLHGYLRWFHDNADLNLAPSVQTQQMLQQKGYARVGVWSRGIDHSQFQPKSGAGDTDDACVDKSGERVFTFLYVGRMAAEKGIDVLCEAIERLESNGAYGRKYRFVFTGDGPYLEIIRTRFSQQIAQKRVELTGFKSGAELVDMYQKADCFVCPSSSETFGNVMLEAMACGLPVICADMGGQLDFAYHMQNAIHFASEQPDALTDALQTALAHPHLLERLAHQALQTAQQRTWDAIFTKLLTEYKLLVDVRLLGDRTIC